VTDDQEPVAWMIWLHGPAGVFENKDEAMLELMRRNREYPDPNRKLIELRAHLADAERWTLLLTGSQNGIVGKFGSAFAGHPEHYRRVDVYSRSPINPEFGPIPL
jgi:hypothetical protein